MSISTIKLQDVSQESVSGAIAQLSKLPGPSASAVAATVSALTSVASPACNFAPATLTLYPEAHDNAVSDLKTSELLSGLAHSAHDAAQSLACGSLLAGPGSESDDFGDVAFWLGEGNFGAGHEIDVLRALGLAQGSGAGSKYSSVESISPEMLPVGTPTTGSAVSKLAALLKTLSGVYCFRVPLGSARMAFFLVGHSDIDTNPGWAGLAGIGIWSDE